MMRGLKKVLFLCLLPQVGRVGGAVTAVTVGRAKTLTRDSGSGGHQFIPLGFPGDREEPEGFYLGL